MAFENTQNKRRRVYRVSDLQGQIRSMANTMESLVDVKTKFANSSDPAVSVAIGLFYTNAERDIILAMISEIDPILAAWKNGTGAAGAGSVDILTQNA